MFEQFDIHCTWATVGLLHHSSKDEIQAVFRTKNIPYDNDSYSPFQNLKDQINEIPFEILNATEEIQAVLSAKNQELASHTYSHYYTLEVGQNIDHFKEDLSEMNRIEDSIGQAFNSIVFPRNQVNNEYLKLLSEKGYLAYRGNQRNNLWASSPYAKESIAKKGKRFIDAYYNISATASESMDSLEVVNGLINIPASRFLRPSSGKSILEKRKIKRIKEEMSRAAKEGKIYHLWWHPHNFSNRTDEHFAQLIEILKHQQALQKEHDFVSLNMKEIAERAKK